MKKLIISKLARVNVPRKVCDLLIGKDHNMAYRIVGGAVLMVAGVALAKVKVHGVPYAEYVADGLGYMLHGMGCVPLVDYLLVDEAEVTASALIFPVIELDEEVET